MKKVYMPRLLENELEANLNSSGCVLIAGPKFCGKTTLGKKYAKSETNLKTSNDILLAEIDPKSALLGDRPHIIDEWQKVPEIWNVIKDDLDNDYQFGKYILTGSTTPVDTSKIKDSAAGRISSMVLRPFSLYESKESKGIVSIIDLFNKNYHLKTYYYDENELSLENLAFLICRGGWPISLLAEKPYQLRVTKNYFDGIFRLEDESAALSIFLKDKNVDLLKIILKSYARNISTQAKKKTMIEDIIASGIRLTLDEKTFDDYAKTLGDLYIIYSMPAWNLNLRSSVVVRKTPTIHFYDTSIACQALGLNPNDLLNDLNSLGLFFEDFAMRDLAVYADYHHAKISHYRDSSGQEIDAIFELENGNYGAIEIKLRSEKNIGEGIKSLLSFEKKIVEGGLKKPAFKMVLTSHGECYRSKDGVYVVPINYLKP